MLPDERVVALEREMLAEELPELERETLLLEERLLELLRLTLEEGVPRRVVLLEPL